MLCSGVTACQRYGVCTFRCAKCTQHSKQYTHHTSDMLPHHCITCNDIAFTEF